MHLRSSLEIVFGRVEFTFSTLCVVTVIQIDVNVSVSSRPIFIWSVHRHLKPVRWTHIQHIRTVVHMVSIEHYRYSDVIWVWTGYVQHYITGCAVAQHCYNGDVSFLWEKWELWPPVKSKPSNRLTNNLSGLITSTRWTFVPNLVKIRLRGTSGQRGEI